MVAALEWLDERWTSNGRACRETGIAAYSLHDLRHRRCSLWIAQGLDAVRVKAWSGHSKSSTLPVTYSHVMIDQHPEHGRDPAPGFKDALQES